MACCYVEINGDDGALHAVTLEASSLFDAANKAIEGWARLYWYRTDAPLTVHYGEQRWKVSQEKVREWRKLRR